MGQQTNTNTTNSIPTPPSPSSAPQSTSSQPPIPPAPSNPNQALEDNTEKILATKKIILAFIIIVTVAIAAAAFLVAQKVKSESSSTGSNTPTTSANGSNIPVYRNTSGSATASTTPTPKPSTSPTVTSTPTPSVSTTQVASNNSKTLVCGGMTFTQNGNGVSTINAGSATLVVTAVITSPTNGNIDYTGATWQVQPQAGQVSVSNAGNYITWTPPTTQSKSQTYTFSVSNVTDSNGGALTAACTGQLVVNTATLAQATPTPTPTASPTATPMPTVTPTSNSLANTTVTPTVSTTPLPQTGDEMHTYSIALLVIMLAAGFIVAHKKAKRVTY